MFTLLVKIETTFCSIIVITLITLILTMLLKLPVTTSAITLYRFSLFDNFFHLVGVIVDHSFHASGLVWLVWFVYIWARPIFYLRGSISKKLLMDRHVVDQANQWSNHMTWHTRQGIARPSRPEIGRSKPSTGNGRIGTFFLRRRRLKEAISPPGMYCPLRSRVTFHLPVLFLLFQILVFHSLILET